MVRDKCDFSLFYKVKNHPIYCVNNSVCLFQKNMEHLRSLVVVTGTSQEKCLLVFSIISQCAFNHKSVYLYCRMERCCICVGCGSLCSFSLAILICFCFHKCCFIMVIDMCIQRSKLVIFDVFQCAIQCSLCWSLLRLFRR